MIRSFIGPLLQLVAVQWLVAGAELESKVDRAYQNEPVTREVEYVWNLDTGGRAKVVMRRLRMDGSWTLAVEPSTDRRSTGGISAVDLASLVDGSLAEFSRDVPREDVKEIIFDYGSVREVWQDVAKGLRKALASHPGRATPKSRFVSQAAHAAVSRSKGLDPLRRVLKQRQIAVKEIGHPEDIAFRSSSYGRSWRSLAAESDFGLERAGSATIVLERW